VAVPAKIDAGSRIIQERLEPLAMQTRHTRDAA